MKKLILILSAGIFVLTSCQKTKDPGATAVVAMANEWWVTVTPAGDPHSKDYVKIKTANTAANGSEIWIDDFPVVTATAINGNIWAFQAKAQTNLTSLTFKADSAVSVVAGYNIKVQITGGKILLNSAKSKSGNIVDSIYMKIGFGDDTPGTVYIVEGHARTRFIEDDY